MAEFSGGSDDPRDQAYLTPSDPVVDSDSGAGADGSASEDAAPSAEFEAVEGAAATPAGANSTQDEGAAGAESAESKDEAKVEQSAAGARAAKPARVEPEPGPEPEIKREWYILKVQSNREDSIRDALQRRVAMAGLEQYVGDIIVPTEMVSEFKGGKKRIVKRKLYPGYLVVHMEINDDTWFLVRETPGIGDFTGSVGKPTPMLPHEVAKVVQKQDEKTDEAPKLQIAFNKGDRVKINEGTFENFEGEVDAIDEANGRVTVMINIFGRSTPVELEYWQIESI